MATNIQKGELVKKNRNNNNKEKDKKSEVKIGAVLSAIHVIVNICIGIFYTPILIRQLGQIEYGLYSLVYSFMLSFTALDLGLGNAIVVYTAKYNSKKDKKESNKLNGMLLTVYTLIGFVALILGTVVYFNIENIFIKAMNEYEISQAKRMVGILTIYMAINFPLTVFPNIIIANEKFIFNKTNTLIQMLSAPLITLPFLFIYPKAWIVVLITVITSIISMIISLIYAFKKLKIGVSFKSLKFNMLKEIFGYSLFVFLQDLSIKINTNIGQIVLGATQGTVAVAIYAIGVKIHNIYSILARSLVTVMLPRVVKMEEAKTSNKEFSNLFLKSARIEFLILALILSTFIIFGKNFLGVWAGKEYERAYLITVILLLSDFIQLTQAMGNNILQAKHKHKYKSYISLFGSLLNLILAMPVAKKHGMLGIAILIFITQILIEALMLNIYYWKGIGLDIPKYFRNLLKMSIPIIPLTVITYYIYNTFTPTRFIYMIAGMFIYFMAYCIITWLFSMNNYEKTLVKSFLNKVRKKV